METGSAPVLSTPAEHIFEAPAPTTVQSSEAGLSEEQLYIQYEIKRTVNEIRNGRWKSIALQFPDEMLVDAPRVFERLRDGLRRSRRGQQIDHPVAKAVEPGRSLDDNREAEKVEEEEENAERLCILGDTSYGACCVDEVAAEHVDAEVVVHYGRSCLSPTARLPVIYVFTSKPLDLDTAVASFRATYPEKSEKVCLMADIPYAHRIPSLHERLRRDGYENVHATEVLRNPSSPLPNRSLPKDVEEAPDTLKDYSIFHVSTPPTSLLLVLSSRVKAIHILPTDTTTPQATEATSSQLLRRRYAIITRLSTVPIFGILINTLSVSNYMAALSHCQDLITRAGKRSYVFVVGKVNAAKLANFAEIGGWVVIGCWESSLIESKDFYRPVITPFELEVALQPDSVRQWGGEWIADFATLLGREKDVVETTGEGRGNGDFSSESGKEASWDDEPSDDEPPEFDLRTGRYVSRSRPMPRAKLASSTNASKTENPSSQNNSALALRPKVDVATINGAVSPAAEFLRSQRTWQGLGSDYEVAYERDSDGKIIGAAMEEGRSGVAKGYVVGENSGRS